MSGLFDNFDPLQQMAMNQNGVTANTITRGSLISFNYPRSLGTVSNIIHDPYPMVIITDVWSNYIRGVNLHYLTFPYVKKILENSNPNFSYANIKPDPYVANAFRMYVRSGIRLAKRLDTQWLKTVLQSVRSFDAGEIEKIRANIERQIQARLQTKANELTSYEQWRASLNKNQQGQFNNKVQKLQNVITQGHNNNLIQPKADMGNQTSLNSMPEINNNE